MKARRERAMNRLEILVEEAPELCRSEKSKLLIRRYLRAFLFGMTVD